MPVKVSARDPGAGNAHRIPRFRAGESIILSFFWGGGSANYGRKDFSGSIASRGRKAINTIWKISSGTLRLRDPATILFISRDTCSDNIAKLCGDCFSASRVVPEYCWLSQLVSGMSPNQGTSVFPIALPTVLGDTPIWSIAHNDRALCCNMRYRTRVPVRN